MSLLETVYASAPADQVIIDTLEIKPPAQTPIRVCTGFDDQALTLEDDTTHTFTAGPVEIKRPAKTAGEKQTLQFAIGFTDSTPQKIIDAALEAGDRVPMIYRQYLASDKTAPATKALTMTITGGTFEGLTLSIEASFYDLLNTAWPRDRYTADFAPGLRYI